MDVFAVRCDYVVDGSVVAIWFDQFVSDILWVSYSFILIYSSPGYVFCRNPKCEQQLGPHIQYKAGRRTHGYALSAKAVMWRSEEDQNRSQIKQWSKVPFRITEENLME